MDYISNSLKILLCKLCNALHAHYIFYSERIFLCKAELSRAFEKVVLCAPQSAANSRVVVLCAPKSAEIYSRLVVLCAPKRAANSRMFVLCASRSAAISRP